MEITLHLGVHKTGTTFLQKAFANNEKLIESKTQIHYVRLGKIRNHFMPSYQRFLNKKIPIEKGQSAFDNLISKSSKEPVEKIFFSEENLIGYPKNIIDKPYPDVKNRLQAFKEMTAKHSISQIFICIRSYDTFLQSLYLEAMRNNLQYFPLKGLNYENLMRFSWLDLLSQVADVFDKETIRVLTYENFKAGNNHYINTLLDTKIAEEFNSTPHARVSHDSSLISVLDKINSLGFSKPFVNHISKLLLTSQPELSKGALIETRKNYLFSDDQVGSLSEKYKQDLDLIKAEYSFI